MISSRDRLLLSLPALPGDRNRQWNVDAVDCENPPADIFIHPDRGGEDAGSCIRDPKQFKEPLHAAVLAVLAVKGEADDIHPGLQGFIGDRFGFFREVLRDVAGAVPHEQFDRNFPESRPAVHENGDRVIGTAVDLAEDIPSALKGDFLFRGEASHDDPDPDFICRLVSRRSHIRISPSGR